MGSRTPDLLIANETLYQLSYDPIQHEVSDTYYGIKKLSGKRKEHLGKGVDESRVPVGC